MTIVRGSVAETFRGLARVAEQRPGCVDPSVTEVPIDVTARNASTPSYAADGVVGPPATCGPLPKEALI